MKKGMIFDLYQDGHTTKRVMAINDRHVIDLDSLNVIHNVDFENEVGEVLIQNIFEQ